MKNQPTPPDSINVEIYYGFDEDNDDQLQYHLEDIVNDFRQKLLEIGAISETQYITLFNTNDPL